MAIVAFEPIRQKYVFRSCSIRINAEKIYFPCIVLYEKQTNIVVACPGFERWYLKLAECEAMATATMRKRSYNICTFLNFWLWNTKYDTLNELTITDIRNFIIGFKALDNGTERDLESWNRGIADVYNFLIRYYEYNKDLLEFSFSPEDLFTVNVIRDSKTGKKSIIRKYNKFSTKAPAKLEKKNRLLVHGYLSLILCEAKKYDPMLTLAIALQAYAGLREGEIVNLTRGSIQQIYAGFGQIGKIVIDLSHPAPFRRENKKTEFGNIKKLRKQEVYPDFIEELLTLYEEHENYLTVKGASSDTNAPLFINKYGQAMSVASYCGRVKKLFKNNFLPDLQISCEQNGTWAENAPYIEAYQNNYPGAHMFRHWYTMYLVTQTDLSCEEIAKWRGDSSIESMMSYVHVNADMIALYKNSAYRFQETILEEIW